MLQQRFEAVTYTRNQKSSCIYTWDHSPLPCFPTLLPCPGFSHFAHRLLFCILCVAESPTHEISNTHGKFCLQQPVASNQAFSFLSVTAEKSSPANAQFPKFVFWIPFPLVSQKCFIHQPISVMIFKLSSTQSGPKTCKRHFKVFFSAVFIQLSLISLPCPTQVS